MLLFLWFLCEKLHFKSLVQVLQVQRASYATLPETKDAHFWPSMTGHSKCWFIAMYGFRNGLWHGHEIGKQFFIKTQISLKTRKERTGNFQSIQKTMNILVFSGTVFFFLILGVPSVCVHLSWSVRERLGLSSMCLLTEVIPPMFTWIIFMVLSIYQLPLRLSNVFKNYLTSWVSNNLPQKTVLPL